MEEGGVHSKSKRGGGGGGGSGGGGGYIEFWSSPETSLFRACTMCIFRPPN